MLNFYLKYVSGPTVEGFYWANVDQNNMNFRLILGIIPRTDVRIKQDVFAEISDNIADNYLTYNVSRLHKSR